MKMKWEEPKICVEAFEANEYVAACGDTGATYKFVCDAGNGWAGDIYVDGKNLTAGILSSYHACGETHEAPVADEFVEGTFRPALTGNRIPVIVWTDGGRNVHATKNLDISTWEISKS